MSDYEFVIGVSIHDTTLGTTVANLGMTETTFPKPVFVGDTIRAETVVVSVRPSEIYRRAGDRDGHLRSGGTLILSRSKMNAVEH
jgi:acyl dehydratase